MWRSAFLDLFYVTFLTNCGRCQHLAPPHVLNCCCGYARYSLCNILLFLILAVEFHEGDIAVAKSEYVWSPAVFLGACSI